MISSLLGRDMLLHIGLLANAAIAKRRSSLVIITHLLSRLGLREVMFWSGFRL